jgi:hypothetical protein
MTNAAVVDESATDAWQLDREALEAFATNAGFAIAVFVHALVLSLYLLIGPSEQRPMLWPVIISAVVTFFPVFVPLWLGHAKFIFSARGKWLRIVDFFLNPGPAVMVAATASAEFPIAALIMLAYAIVLPAQHPRNVVAWTNLIWMPLLIRWIFVPHSSGYSFIFLFAVGVASAALYLVNSHYIDRFRAVRQVIAARKDRLTEATAAQHSLRVAMSLHDGLSGLAAVAEHRWKTAPNTPQTTESLATLHRRLLLEIDGVKDSVASRVKDLTTASDSVGVSLQSMPKLSAWDAVSAEDLLDMLGELVSNCGQHGKNLPSAGVITVDNDHANIDIKTPMPAGFSAKGRGLRNVANRIANSGGSMSVATGGGMFHIVAHVPNRRTAFAPPFLQLAAPSLATLTMISLCCMALIPAWFAWPLLLSQVFSATLHLYQLQYDSTKIRKNFETTEQALLALHIAKRKELVAARLGHYESRLRPDTDADSDRQSNLAEFRRELHALLFALEWQGDNAALARELNLTVCDIPEHDRVSAIHTLKLESLRSETNALPTNTPVDPAS